MDKCAVLGIKKGKRVELSVQELNFPQEI